jgi:uncharacterized protein (TIGR01244 family)
MKSNLLALLLSLALAGICAAQPATAPPLDGPVQSALAVRPAAWATPIDPRRNLYQITPKLYRSAQPEPSDAAWIKQLGIRTIINLRANHRDEDALDLPGVKLVRVPMDTWQIGDDEIVNALRAIAQAQKDGPVLIHCKHGADRTGAVSAMYRILEQGWTPRQALNELEHGNFGFNRIWVNIPHYIKHANIKQLRARLAAIRQTTEGADDKAGSLE